jgi:transcriptional regulator with XRE-family HTH domain
MAKKKLKIGGNSAFERLGAFKKTKEYFGLALRMSFSDLVTTTLLKKEWTQRKLGKKASMKDSFISRILTSSSDYTFDTAGAILHALGVRAKLVVISDERSASTFDPSITCIATEGTTDDDSGQSTIGTTGTTRAPYSGICYTENARIEYKRAAAGAQSGTVVNLG